MYQEAVSNNFTELDRAGVGDACISEGQTAWGGVLSGLYGLGRVIAAYTIRGNHV